MPTDEIRISIRNLVKKFGTQTVLTGVNLDIKAGETIVIMGGSGCGKTTLLRLLIGSHQPTSGTISLLGQDIASLDSDGFDALKKQFGILFQSGALFQSMTVGDNVALPLQENSDLAPETIEMIVKMKLELVGLRQHANKLPSQISGGMMKRAGLARAMAMDPKILFYDEPSAGLDPVTSAEIDQLILELTRNFGVTSVVVTHEMDSAFTIADRMVMLDGGRVLMIDKREEFDRIRKLPESEAKNLTEDQQIVYQFLRGAADGPITRRRSADDYREDLLGIDAQGNDIVSGTPAARR
ncbi:MAG: ABC transporter ATP-binding protein [Planctomycetota bacterium]|nr:ABC transporter ATP-binding protein [Planctomycetota bacterium]MDA1262213.1 ABC transporter ATP-binding protein [Planctomycetota bacterium]